MGLGRLPHVVLGDVFSRVLQFVSSAGPAARPGFAGTTRFTNQTLSRFELNRPFPAFGGFSMNQQNLGKMTYDSMQLVANKGWTKGVTINVGYTWVPRWTEEGANTTTGIGAAYVDEVSLLQNKGPYFSQRLRRLGAAVVPQQAQSGGLPARRLVDRADACLPVRTALGHAR